MTDFESRFWSSRDGLKLHFRDYSRPEGAGAEENGASTPVVCLHGLTRNARDFENLAPRLATRRRVLCPDMRGRGESEYARDSASYMPKQYIEDLIALFEQESIDRFIAIGTSMGGLMTMVMATAMPDRIVGAVLNDIGPQLDPAGLSQIKDYVGQGRSYATWVHAARGIEAGMGAAHPDQPLDFWIGMAKRLMAPGTNGRIVFDYDMKIAEPFMKLDVSTQPDLWPAWDALAARPVLVVRGNKSNLFSQDTLDEMIRRAPSAQSVILDNVGHAPTLDEPDAVAAIERLLASLP